MIPEQQRAVDEAIINGDLVDAIRRYRAGGADLATAKAYVERRSAALEEQPFSAPATPSTPSASSTAAAAALMGRGFQKRLTIWIVCVVVFAIATGLIPVVISILAIGKAFGAGGLLAQFTIVHEPYYAELSARIAADPNFRNALGTPIAIDDGHVVCSSISDNAVMKQANCSIPVSGPKDVGRVNVRVLDRPGSLDAAMQLHVGDRSIPSSS